LATQTHRRKKPKQCESPQPQQSGGVSESLLLQAALDAFVEKGFHGTSMRDIAARAGSSVSHTYYYFPSKQHILQVIMSDITQELVDRLTEAATDAGDDDPAAKLAAIVRACVLLHAQRPAESFIGNTELRSLCLDDRLRIVDLRDEASAIFKSTIRRGLSQGAFTCPEPGEASLAVMTMCAAVSTWYRPDGPVPAPVLADRFAAIALRMVGANAPTSA